MYDYATRREANDRSRDHAEHHYEIWEAHELELLTKGWADNESTLPEIAELLGRTIEACRQKYYDLQRRPEVEAKSKRAKSQHNAQWDKGWTDLASMGF